MTTLGAPVSEVRRDNDWAPDEPGELVGLLIPVDDGRWVPATVFRSALGPAADEALAESLVREHGLSSLAERWWVRVGDAPWRRAWLLEVKRDRVRLRWDDPMLMQPGHGEWLRLDEAVLQRLRPAG
jgi:hypothetical protein